MSAGELVVILAGGISSAGLALFAIRECADPPGREQRMRAGTPGPDPPMTQEDGR